MATPIEITEGGKWLLFIAAIAAVIGAVGKLIVQPLFSAWIFFTLGTDKARIRGIIQDAFKDEIAEVVKSAKDFRECQSEQGEQIAFIAGRLRNVT